jgi:hypothetical protein
MCFYCGRPINAVEISPWNQWIAEQVQKKHAIQQSGQLHTRKQSFDESDVMIDSDGLGGELAACYSARGSFGNGKSRLKMAGTIAGAIFYLRGPDYQSPWK